MFVGFRGDAFPCKCLFGALPGKDVKGKNEEIHGINSANDHHNITDDSNGANRRDDANGCNSPCDVNNHFFNDGLNNCADDINDTDHDNNADHHNDIINGIDIRRADLRFPKRFGKRLGCKLCKCKICCMAEQCRQLGRWGG